jgi:hypothetical protein
VSVSVLQLMGVFISNIQFLNSIFLYGNRGLNGTSNCRVSIHFLTCCNGLLLADDGSRFFLIIVLDDDALI